MRSFLFKVLIFFSLYISISLLISFMVPYHWGNPWYSSKISYLESQPNQLPYNTFFFGSRRTYKQINPIVFDQVFNERTGFQVNSFNLGAPATFVPQTYYLYEKFLHSDMSNDAKFCFIELDDVTEIGDDQMHQERTNYYINVDILNFAVRSFWNKKNWSIGLKGFESAKYLLSYIENIMHLGHFGEQLTENNYYDESFLGPQKNGFFPLETEIQITQNSGVKDALRHRRVELLEEPEKLYNRLEKARESYSDLEGYFDKSNLKKISSLIQKSREKGIKLCFIIAPRSTSKDLINLSCKIPSSHLIDMANPQEYPEFYLVKNSFDVGHLNTSASNQYSRDLALEFYAKIQN